MTLKVRYFPTQPSEYLPSYTGSPKELLDENIHLHEVTGELNAHLKIVWKERNFAEDWKAAEVRVMPKPGKPPAIENVRFIFSTAFVRKLLDHIILNLLQPFLDDSGRLTKMITGFRSHLLTHNILLQLKEEVIVPVT
ncbi:MAG: hypothetical protein AB8U72_04615 [Anaplasma ovis]